MTLQSKPYVLLAHLIVLLFIYLIVDWTVKYFCFENFRIIII